MAVCPCCSGCVVEVICCPFVDIPCKLTLTINSTDCNDTWTLTWQPTTVLAGVTGAWVPTVPADGVIGSQAGDTGGGSCTVQGLVCDPADTTWKLIVSGLPGALFLTADSCDPLHLSLTVGAATCGCGALTINVTLPP